MRSHRFLLFIPLALLLAACSGDNGDDHKGPTEKLTHEVADKAVRQVQDPMDKAREAASATEKYNQQVQKESSQ